MWRVCEQKYGIESNDSHVAASALAVGGRVVQVLGDEAVPWKNLGALHQHLMNVLSDTKAQSVHMRAMVHAYTTFVNISRGRHDSAASSTTSTIMMQHYSHHPAQPDPDVDILDKWVREVAAWMQEHHDARDDDDA